MAAPKTSPRLCNLAINNSGSWKNIVTFDIDQDGIDDLLLAAATIARASHLKRKPTLRVAIADGVAAPLKHWSVDTGWRDWK